jgi:hypothetical protein
MLPKNLLNDFASPTPRRFNEKSEPYTRVMISENDRKVGSTTKF